jgi:hypothetical protein
LLPKSAEVGLAYGKPQLKDNMKKSITLTMSDEELMELERILLDDDGAKALRFLKIHLDKQVKSLLTGEGH